MGGGYKCFISHCYVVLLLWDNQIIMVMLSCIMATANRISSSTCSALSKMMNIMCDRPLTWCIRYEMITLLWIQLWQSRVHPLFRCVFRAHLCVYAVLSLNIRRVQTRYVNTRDINQFTQPILVPPFKEVQTSARQQYNVRFLHGTATITFASERAH